MLDIFRPMHSSDPCYSARMYFRLKDRQSFGDAAREGHASRLFQLSTGSGPRRKFFLAVRSLRRRPHFRDSLHRLGHGPDRSLRARFCTHGKLGLPGSLPHGIITPSWVFPGG